MPTLRTCPRWSRKLDVKTGAEKMLAPVDLPASTESFAGFSMHSEGFEPRSKTWLDRLFHR